MAVTWRTDTSVSVTRAQILPDNPSTFLADSAETFSGEYTDVHGDGIVSRYHSVNFTGLRPESTYLYRVGSDLSWSEWFEFKTASKTNKQFSFIYFGDSQVRDKSLWTRVIRSAFTNNSKAAFTLFAGDLVDGGDGNTLQDEEWGEWHEGGSFINSMIPVIATPGNHEYLYPGDRTRRELNRYWIPQFTFPENGPKGLEETVYYIDYQNLRVISLNTSALGRSEEAAAIQTSWLENLLKNNPCQWTIITFHHPLYSTSKTRDNKRVRDNLLPLFQKYHVDLVLTGHDHTYARGFSPADPEPQRQSDARTVYIVSVSGAKQYLQDAERWWDIGATNTQFYQIITVDDKTMSYKAFNSSDELFDQFYIKRNSRGKKRIVMPDTNK